MAESFRTGQRRRLLKLARWLLLLVAFASIPFILVSREPTPITGRMRVNFVSAKTIEDLAEQQVKKVSRIFGRLHKVGFI